MGWDFEVCSVHIGENASRQISDRGQASEREILVMGNVFQVTLV